jgi:hypothetical protein
MIVWMSVQRKRGTGGSMLKETGDLRSLCMHCPSSGSGTGSTQPREYN